MLERKHVEIMRGIGCEIDWRRLIPKAELKFAELHKLVINPLIDALAKILDEIKQYKMKSMSCRGTLALRIPMYCEMTVMISSTWDRPSAVSVSVSMNNE